MRTFREADRNPIESPAKGPLKNDQVFEQVNALLVTLKWPQRLGLLRLISDKSEASGKKAVNLGQGGVRLMIIGTRLAASGFTLAALSLQFDLTRAGERSPP